MVPDPLKLVSKLGRKDLVNFDHVEEYRVSLLDLLKPYSDAKLNHLISEAVYERYKGAPQDLSAVCTAINKLVSDKELFASLYYTTDSDILCTDASRPKLH